MLHKKFLTSVLNVGVLCVVIFFVSAHFVYAEKFIGYVLVALAALCLWTLRFFNVTVKSVKPDIVFGVIDNGILAVMAVAGGELAGVAGAVVGGVVGNAITDGIAGLFEGYSAEKGALDRRTIIGSAVGKMAGCLLGAGVVLIGATLFHY